MMFLNYIALLTAISISAVAAYYSIYGLTAIFSGVFWPIVIMGGVLEVGKIVATVWMHTYWKQLKWALKAYMCIAVIVLMFITSMGIFGFLSKAHIEVTSQAGGSQLLIAQLDQNISIEQRRIDDSRKILLQMDDAVNGLLKGSGANAERDNNRTAQLTTQATKLRDSQKKERNSINEQIDNANNRITDLNKQKLKLEQEQLKIEAEVGPIKYIAQMLYDDTVGKDLLERAVRWVIVVIVAVFDPLAVAMVLGVTMVINRRRDEQQQKIQQEQLASEYVDNVRNIDLPAGMVREVEKIVEVPVPVHVRDPDLVKEYEQLQTNFHTLHAQKENIEQDLAHTLVLLEEEKAREHKIIERAIIKEVEKIVEVPVEVVQEKIVQDTTEIERLEEELAEALTMLEDAKNQPPTVEYVERIVEKTVEVPVEVKVIQEVEVEVEKIVEVPVEVEVVREVVKPIEVIKEVEVVREVPVEVIKEVEVIKQVEDTSKIELLSRELNNLLNELNHKDEIIRQLDAKRELYEQMASGVDASEFNANASSTNLGPTLPAIGDVGQLFLLTTNNQLYKFTGNEWINVDKTQNTSYTYDTHWQHWILGKIGRGEIEWDDLTSQEQSVIEQLENDTR